MIMRPTPRYQCAHTATLFGPAPKHETLLEEFPVTIQWRLGCRALDVIRDPDMLWDSNIESEPKLTGSLPSFP